MSVIITAPLRKCIPAAAITVPAGDLTKLTSWAANNGDAVEVQRRGNQLAIRIKPEFNDLVEDIPLATLAKLIDEGCEVYNYPAFVQLPLANYDNNVPSYLRGSTTQTGDPPVETPVTWRNWKTAHNPHKEVAPNVLIPMNWGGQETLGSKLRQLATDGYTVKSMKDWPESPGEP